MGRTALVVDDNLNNLMLENDLLEVDGFTVFTAENGLDGISIARKQIPDVIVMDLRLPDMRGSEAARILRQDEETRHIPIIFVSASVLPEGRDEFKDIVQAGFIGKPINTRTFAKEVCTLIA